MSDLPASRDAVTPPPRRRIFADLSPLRESRDYRLLFSGQAVSNIGRQVTVVAVPVQVFELTHSSLAVGMLGLASLGPILLLSLVGGAIADAIDRRRLLVVVQVLMGITSAALALNAMQGSPALWPLYVLGPLSAGLAGIDLPTRNAMVPSLVRREKFPAAVALNQIIWQVGLVAGPALAGVVIAQVDLAAAYWFDVGTFVVATVTVLAIRPHPPVKPEAIDLGPQPVALETGWTLARPRALAGSVWEGLRFLRGRRLLVSTFVIDIIAMTFGMPRALFPALGTELFGGGAATIGLLYAAPGAGALVGAVLTGWVGSVRRQGLAVILSVLGWGAAVATFGLVTWLPVGLLLLALAGAADMVSAVFRNTILQLSVPDNLRGRLSSVHIAVVSGGPYLGDAESGVVAALTSARFSVVSGGAACVLGALTLARVVPELAAYDVTTAPAVLPEDD